MSSSRFALLAAPLIALFLPLPATAETRESYLQRLSDICSVDCMQPRQLLRTARKRGKGAEDEMAAIIDVAAVSLWNGKYMLHSAVANASPADASFARVLGGPFNSGLGQRTPTRFRPITDPQTIVIEMDEATFFDLLNVPSPKEQAALRAAAKEEGGIIVERDRTRQFTKPTLAKLRSTFQNRRIVVRGQPRLEVAFIGARRDFRRKKLFIELDNADDLAVLPRYNSEGEPIFDGPLKSLAKDYQKTAG